MNPKKKPKRRSKLREALEEANASFQTVANDLTATKADAARWQARAQELEAERNKLRSTARFHRLSMEDLNRLNTRLELVHDLLNATKKLVDELKEPTKI